MIVGVELELINVLPEDQSIVEATRAIETCSASSRLIRLLQSHQVSDFLEPDASSSILWLGSCHALVVSCQLAVIALILILLVVVNIIVCVVVVIVIVWGTISHSKRVALLPVVVVVVRRRSADN